MGPSRVAIWTAISLEAISLVGAIVAAAFVPGFAWLGFERKPLLAWLALVLCSLGLYFIGLSVLAGTGRSIREVSRQGGIPGLCAAAFTLGQLPVWLLVLVGFTACFVNSSN